MKKADGVQKANLFFDRFEAIAEAAVEAMFWVEGRIEDTASAKFDAEKNQLVATRKFKAALRRELKARNFHIWTPNQKWAK